MREGRCTVKHNRMQHKRTLPGWNNTHVGVCIGREILCDVGLERNTLEDRLRESAVEQNTITRATGNSFYRFI